MDKVTCPAVPVWYAEARDTDAAEYQPRIEAVMGGVKRFAGYWPLRDALDDARFGVLAPQIVVSDTVAMTAPPGQPPAAELLRDRSPLTLLYLFSGSVYREDVAAELLTQAGPGDAAPDQVGVAPSRRLIRLWKARRLVAAARPKGDAAGMQRDLTDMVARWNRPAVRRFREYILNECNDPHEPYFDWYPDGNLLSVIDLHREMVLGTELGQEQEAVWANIFGLPSSLELPAAR